MLCETKQSGSNFIAHSTFLYYFSPFWILSALIFHFGILFSCIQSALPPDQLSWCGMDSVLLYWDDMLLMVGPYGDPVRYLYDEPIILIPECDGVRILSNTSMEFLQRVPDSTVSIFKIGSTLPAALLYDALDHFDRRSAKVSHSCMQNRISYLFLCYLYTSSIIINSVRASYFLSQNMSVSQYLWY